MTVRLDNGSVEAIALRVAELLRDEPAADAMVDAAAIAQRLGVSREYVYEHADELGAVRLGEGTKARLRFDPARAVEGFAPRPSPQTIVHTPRPRRRTSDAADLLPVRGNS